MTRASATPSARPSSSSTSSSARLAIALLAARAAFGLAYLASAVRRAPTVWYLPVERAVAFTADPRGLGGSGLAMDWYGRTGGALAAALVAGGAAWLVCRRGPLARALTRPPFVIASARAVGLMILVDFTYFGWTLAHARPTPLPWAP